MLIPTLPAPLSGSQAESCQAQGKTKEKHFHGGRAISPSRSSSCPHGGGAGAWARLGGLPPKTPQVAMLSEKEPRLSLFVSGSGVLGVLLK